MSIAELPVQQVPIRLRMRPDLSATRQYWQGVEYWVVKEPLGQKYFQLPPQVFFLLQQLDGQRSAQEILENYHSEFAPRRLSLDQLHSLLQRFHRDALILSDASGQGTELLKRGKKNKRLERLATWSNILAIRFRGVDPDRLLTRLNGWTWWLFTKPAAFVVALAALTALLSVIINWTEFTARLPGFDQFFDYRRWFMMGCTLAVAKIIHEFGHGLSCKRFGGECHEIGFMLLVMTPCLYCNVSDSWRMPNKWHRAVIGAAGMYFEIILASIATFVWWFAAPGIVQDICLQFMLIASVSTVVFNGNPLLRFDGYYILSDLLEIPNLHQKATRSLTTLLGRKWLGLEIPDDPLLPRNRMGWFALFTVAATVYKWFIAVSILLFLTRWLRPYGIESVGKAIAWVAVTGMMGWPLYRLYRYFAVPGRIMQIKPKRFAIASGIVFGTLGLLMLVPFPHYLRCRVIVLPAGIETVYVAEPGRLVELVRRPGDQVGKGDLLARLVNEELATTIAQNSADLARMKVRRDLILQSATLDPRSSMQLALVPSLEADIVRLEEKAAVLAERGTQLEIHSPLAGKLVATPWQAQTPGQFETPLVDRAPLLSEVQYRPTLGRGERLGEVVDTSFWRAAVLLDEQQIKFVKAGQRFWVRLNAHPGIQLESTISGTGVSDRLAGRDTRDESADQMQQRSRVPDLLAELVPASNQESIQYFALAQLPEPEGMRYSIGLEGQGRIKTGYRSLWQRIRWWFNQNFGS